jgi:hypothetical protein
MEPRKSSYHSASPKLRLPTSAANSARGSRSAMSHSDEPSPIIDSSGSRWSRALIGSSQPISAQNGNRSTRHSSPCEHARLDAGRSSASVIAATSSSFSTEIGIASSPPPNNPIYTHQWTSSISTEDERPNILSTSSQSIMVGRGNQSSYPGAVFQQCSEDSGRSRPVSLTPSSFRPASKLAGSSDLAFTPRLQSFDRTVSSIGGQSAQAPMTGGTASYFTSIIPSLGEVSVAPDMSIQGLADRKTQLERVRWEKMQKILTLGGKLLHRCPVGWFYQPGPCTGNHGASPFTCNFDFVQSPEYRLFKKNVKFTNYGLCYFCAFYHEPPMNHPRHQKGKIKGESCTYSDILKPIAFMTWVTPAIRDLAFARLNLPVQPFPSRAAFEIWLGNEAGSRAALTNLHELCMAIYDLEQDGGLPSNAPYDTS